MASYSPNPTTEWPYGREGSRGELTSTTRGAHIYKEFRDDFNGGKVTIAAKSFLRYNHPRIKPYPPRGHLTLQIEEQKLPPIK